MNGFLLKQIDKEKSLKEKTKDNEVLRNSVLSLFVFCCFFLQLKNQHIITSYISLVVTPIQLLVY